MAAGMAKALRVCVVGSGPGGLYTTKYLLKALGTNNHVGVDVLEALPTPYGLVRSGVAPDHPEVKSVQNDFDMVMEDERVRFFGNVNVGEDVSVSDLRKVCGYDALVLSYGASFDRMLGIRGEDQYSNIFGARTFVNWYNGHPDFSSDERFVPDLSGDTAIIVGQGNVALDCARILTKSIDELAKTDIAKHALEHLSGSKIKNVKVVGRRGHVQAAFTMKELRELTKLRGVGCVVDPLELERGLTKASLQEIEETRAKKRMNDLLQKVSSEIATERKKDKVIELRFLLSPTEIVGQDGKISSLVLERNELVGEAFNQSASPSGVTEAHDCSLLLRSIGYKSLPIDGVPFDVIKNVAANVGGRVLTSATDNASGLASMYAAGWVKRGPTGIIGTNIIDAKETVAAIVEDFEKGILPVNSSGHKSDISEILRANDCRFVDWNGYRKIEKEENERGSRLTPPKPREKMVNVNEMLQYAL